MSQSETERAEAGRSSEGRRRAGGQSTCTAERFERAKPTTIFAPFRRYATSPLLRAEGCRAAAGFGAERSSDERGPTGSLPIGTTLPAAGSPRGPHLTRSNDLLCLPLRALSVLRGETLPPPPRPGLRPPQTDTPQKDITPLSATHISFSGTKKPATRLSRVLREVLSTPPRLPHGSAGTPRSATFPRPGSTPPASVPRPARYPADDVP